MSGNDIDTDNAGCVAEGQVERMRRLLVDALPQMSPRRRAAIETILAALALDDEAHEKLGNEAAAFLEERGYATDGGALDLAETEKLMEDFAQLYREKP